jgi:hypothetical protein
MVASLAPLLHEGEFAMGRQRERRKNQASASATPSAAAAGRTHLGYPVVDAAGRSISRRAGTTTGVAFETEALGSEESEGSTRKNS